MKGNCQHRSLHRNMDNFSHQHGKASPAEGCRQTDISFQIQFHVTVVPVSDMKQPFHGSPRKILKNCGGSHAHKEHKPDILSHRNRCDQNNHCAGSVKREHRAMHESPIDPPVLFHRYIAALPDPSDKTVYKEKNNPLRKIIGLHYLSSISINILTRRW